MSEVSTSPVSEITNGPLSPTRQSSKKVKAVNPFISRNKSRGSNALDSNEFPSSSNAQEQENLSFAVSGSQLPTPASAPAPDSTPSTSRLSLKDFGSTTLLDRKMKEQQTKMDDYMIDDADGFDDIEEQDSEPEIAMGVDESRYTMQRQPLMSRRTQFVESLKTYYMEPWKKQINSCREIHAAVFNQKLTGINTRLPGFAFARDDTGNTVFHTAMLGAASKVRVYEELARMIDRSEFGQSILPDVLPKATPSSMVGILTHDFLLQQDELDQEAEQSINQSLNLGNSKDNSVNNGSSKLTSNVSTMGSGKTSSGIPSAVLMAGWLNKRRPGNGFKRRWCVATPDELRYYDSDDTNAACKDILSLAGCQFYVQPADSTKGQPSAMTCFVIKTSEGSQKEKSMLGKLLTGNKQKSDTMEFVASSELEAQQWVYILRAITGHVAALPTLLPIKCINIEARAVILNMPNESGETPLHILARLSANNNGDDGKLNVLTCLQWLFSNECNPFAVNKEGLTAVEVARQKDNLEFVEWCKHFTNRMLHDTRGTNHPYPLRTPPMRLPGYSYLSFVLHSHKYIPSASGEARFSHFKEIKLKMFVLSPRREQIDFSQQVDEPLFKRQKQLFWGNSFHVYVPLENLPEGSFILFSLVGTTHTSSSLNSPRETGNPLPRNGPSLTTRSIFRIDNSTIASGLQELEFTETPLTAIDGSVTEAPASRVRDSISNTVLSLSLSITRIAL